MFNSSIVLKTILRQNSIVEYLERKGYFPIKTYPTGRLTYRCPLPDHNEKKPSFNVYTNDEYENFYCFGCGAKHNIIHLDSFLEGISYRESLSKFGHGLDLEQLDYLWYALEELDKKTYVPVDIEDLGLDLIELTSMCRTYLEKTDQTESEQCIINKIYQQIDDDLFNFCFDSLKETVIRVPVRLVQRQMKLSQLNQ